MPNVRCGYSKAVAVVGIEFHFLVCEVVTDNFEPIYHKIVIISYIT